ncbi:hypothetical protein F383_28700 [Gossypium arboreum]|uniref:Uncharacterized protein n=1 Tax=Gossypium arboreum TaxID=29729 RepID=A0A0B0MV22_GOSAR|nr:hypothetical protein F383_28700 [Gossypium arboreum]
MSLLFQLVRAYRFSSIELTVHQLRRSLLGSLAHSFRTRRSFRSHYPIADCCWNEDMQMYFDIW